MIKSDNQCNYIKFKCFLAKSFINLAKI